MELYQISLLCLKIQFDVDEYLYQKEVMQQFVAAFGDTCLISGLELGYHNYLHLKSKIDNILGQRENRKYWRLTNRNIWTIHPHFMGHAILRELVSGTVWPTLSP